MRISMNSLKLIWDLKSDKPPSLSPVDSARPPVLYLRAPGTKLTGAIGIYEFIVVSIAAYKTITYLQNHPARKSY